MCNIILNIKLWYFNMYKIKHIQYTYHNNYVKILYTFWLCPIEIACRFMYNIYVYT